MTAYEFNERSCKLTVGLLTGRKHGSRIARFRKAFSLLMHVWQSQWLALLTLFGKDMASRTVP